METTNLSKIKREKMLSTINEIKKSITDEQVLNNLSLIENELTKKKYGLIWEEHEERVDKELKTQIPVFEEKKSKKISTINNNKYNFLLEGDNLHSLYLLEKTHKGRIDFIYIDPPYNTRNKDFMYNDEYVDPENEYKHSKWLSFMSRRLELAKKLLKSDGVIFISIDNNEFAQLKLLCDDIFGENSFVTDIHVEMSATQGMKVKAAKLGNIVKNAENILVYSKNGNKTIGKTILLDPVKYDSHYNRYLIKKDSYYELVDFNSILKKKENNKVYSELELLNFLDKKGKLSNNKISDAYDRTISFREWVNKNAKNICRIHDSIDVEKSIKDKMIIGRAYDYNSESRSYIIMKNKDNSISQIIQLEEKLKKANDFYETYGPTKIRGDWWQGFYLDMGNVSKEGGVPFDNGKKPCRLIRQLIQFATSKDAIILDFFAGSGSTAEAVLQQNKIDGGNREFILCTNNENQICEKITYTRLSNISKKYKYNLKYYNTSYIPRIDTDEENLSKNLMSNIKNLIQLENGIEIDDKIVKVILTEKEIDRFTTNDKELNECEKLYISSDILLTSKQSQIFKDYNIELFIIPEYYFEDEIREVA